MLTVQSLKKKRVRLINNQQMEFLTSTHKFTGMIGGVGSGKSISLGLKSTNIALKGGLYLLTSYTYGALNDVMLPALKDVFGWYGLLDNIHYKINLSNMIVRFMHTGGSIVLRSGEFPDRIRGINADGAGIDEWCYHKNPEHTMRVLIARTRKKKNSQIDIGTTPKGYDYVYEFFVEKKTARKRMINVTTYDNPMLPLDYIETMEEEYSGEYARQELRGEFVDFSTGVIDATNIVIVDRISDEILKSIKVCRFYDLAIKDKQQSDFTASAKGGFSKINGKFYVLDITNEKMHIDKTQRRIVLRAQLEPEVNIGIENEGQMEGYINQTNRDPEMQGINVAGYSCGGKSKVVRAMLWASKIDAGNIIFLKSKWNDKALDQCRGFTQDMTHKHDDMVDAISGLYSMTLNRTSVAGARKPVSILGRR